MRAIVTELHVQLLEGEQARTWRQSTSNPQAYDQFLRSLYGHRRYQTRRDLELAIHFGNQAISLDPLYAHAYANLAFLYRVRFQFGFYPDDQGALQKAYDLATKAQALDPSLPMAVSQLGTIAMAQGKFEEGEELLQRAAAINPEGADTLGNLAHGLVMMGRHAQALDALERAMGLSPHHASWMNVHKAEALFHLNRFEDALPCLRESRDEGGSPLRVPLLMAAAYAALGREQESRAAVEELVKKYPEFRLALFLERRPYRRHEDTERLATLAAKAGIPA